MLIPAPFERVPPGIVPRASMLLFFIVTGTVAAPALRIVVVEGEGAINNVRTHTGHDLVVEVRDDHDALVPGATVIFQAPITGASASFAGGQATFIAPTNTAGRVAVRGLRPNSTAGSFQIRVTAAFNLQTASTVIDQINASPSEGKSSRKLWLFGLAAGAVAGGVFAASHGGAGGSAGPASPAGSITAGPPAFGPPH